MAPTHSTEERLEIVARQALTVISDYLKGEDDSPSAIARARVATGVVASHTRMTQTAGAREALRFAMAREVLGSSEDMRRYVEMTQPPDSAIVAVLKKALPEGGNGAH